MLETDTWNTLAWLESQDAVLTTYHKLHARNLNTRRCMEITAAARQAREYFSQAALADMSVRPLLTFYGVSSLSRACILLLGKHGGETSLAGAHGLQTIDWRETLDGDLAKALGSLGGLKIKTCSGLYLDLAKHTQNQVCIHINSSAVQWDLLYPVPSLGSEASLDDLVARMPDLKDEVLRSSGIIKYNYVESCTFDQVQGLRLKLSERVPCDVITSIRALGYTVSSDGKSHDVAATPIVFSQARLQFVHKHKSPFGISEPHVAERLWNGSSEICIIFKLSYILGMLARYFPTHWMALVNGSKGDRYRTLILEAQRAIESFFPSLVSELITYRISKTT